MELEGVVFVEHRVRLPRVVLHQRHLVVQPAKERGHRFGQLRPLVYARQRRERAHDHDLVHRRKLVPTVAVVPEIFGEPQPHLLGLLIEFSRVEPRGVGNDPFSRGSAQGLSVRAARLEDIEHFVDVLAHVSKVAAAELLNKLQVRLVVLVVTESHVERRLALGHALFVDLVNLRRAQIVRVAVDMRLLLVAELHLGDLTREALHERQACHKAEEREDRADRQGRLVRGIVRHDRDEQRHDESSEVADGAVRAGDFAALVGRADLDQHGHVRHGREEAERDADVKHGQERGRLVHEDQDQLREARGAVTEYRVEARAALAERRNGHDQADEDEHDETKRRERGVRRVLDKIHEAGEEDECEGRKKALGANRIEE
mmetsp:Transcript_38181/g.88061  ORF Transcript_38181/g.88061 Transcript_38181/m.88061 type:complete len:374 (-) Transcript_38181:905-2026(-)